MLGGISALALVLALATGWVLWQGTRVAQALEGARPTVAAIRDDVRAGEETSPGDLASLRSSTGEAAAAVSDPVWRAAARLPWVGVQLRAVDDVVLALDLVASDVLPPVADVASSLSADAVTPTGGRVDLTPLVDAAPRLAAAAAAATFADERVAAVDRDALVPRLASEVDDVGSVLSDVAAELSGAATAATMVPPMLGVDGERTYLVLALNPAELRSGGGIVGALATVTAQDGVLTLGEYRPATSLPRLPEPVLPVSDEEIAVHRDQLGRVIQNATVTPSFPRTAEIAARMWRDDTGQEVDGVLAVDPVALSYLLEATGSVEDPDGQSLDAATAVRSLLVDAYAEHPEPDASDDYFAGASTAVFDELVRGGASGRAVVPALTRAVDEGRVALWSAHDDEQEVLDEALLGGDFLGQVGARSVGVFLDDATGSKLGYYLEADVDIRDVDCSTATPTADVVVRLTSTVPSPADLPPYVLGPAAGTAQAGVLRTNLSFWSPTGGRLVAVSEDGTAVGGARTSLGDREVVVLTSTLAPGETEEYDVRVELADDATGVGVWKTPTVDGTGRVVASRCS